MAASALWPLNFGLQNVTYTAVYFVGHGGGYILAIGGWSWMVADIFWQVVGGGGWWWVVVETFWLVVGGGGWWHSLV